MRYFKYIQNDMKGVPNTTIWVTRPDGWEKCIYDPENLNPLYHQFYNCRVEFKLTNVERYNSENNRVVVEITEEEAFVEMI